MSKRKAAPIGKGEQHFNIKSEQDILKSFTSIQIKSKDIVEYFSINKYIGFDSGRYQFTQAANKMGKK
jgi:hypothetical protein